MKEITGLDLWKIFGGKEYSWIRLTSAATVNQYVEASREINKFFSLPPQKDEQSDECPIPIIQEGP
jgi:hypothetical protein